MTPEESVEVFEHCQQTAHVANERAVAAEVFFFTPFNFYTPENYWLKPEDNIRSPWKRHII